MKLPLSHCLDFLSGEPAGQTAFSKQAASDANLEVFHAMVA